ncbi:hypothetical protein NFC81_11180 [Salinispirillum sp. LH 10-3-1]|uniref:TIGR04219 family outer membrane beta-barrel protein n=1 Tax=Salinispirillum sp. LH 10-3-1 TaxID=2952525 RepID=A0AB38YDD5_9GAMM
MKKLLLAAAVAASVPSAQALPFFDFDFGAGGAFNTLNDGSIGDDVTLTTNPDKIELDLQAKMGFYLQGRVGMPVLPDLKVRYETLRMESGDANGNFDFFGTTFNVEGEAILDMTHLDTALVFGPKFIPFVDYLDVGVNLRWLLGGFEAEDSGGNERVEQAFEFEGIPFVVPMLHFAAATTIPVADVQLSGALSTFPVTGLNMTDWNLKARYYAPLPINMLAKVGVEAGYRKWTIDIDGTKAELIPLPEEAQLQFDASGFFLGAVVTF